MFDSTPDIDFMLKDAGVPVAHGLYDEESSYGIVDQHDDVMYDNNLAQFLGRLTKVTVREGVFSAISIGDEITFSNKVHRVVQTGLKSDGKIREILVVFQEDAVTQSSLDTLIQSKILTFFSGRDWRKPFNWSQPIDANTPGRRATGGGGVLVPDFERYQDSAYHITIPAGANNYWEVGDAFWHFPSKQYKPYVNAWKIWMTMERGTLSGTPTGECCQGIGYGGNVVVNPPYVGTVSIGPFYQLRWNFTSSLWEILCSPGNGIQAFSVTCAVQPPFLGFPSGQQKFPHCALEWIPATATTINTVVAYINGIEIGRVVDQRNSSVTFQDTYPFMTYFVCNGSGGATAIDQAGFYFPRVYQQIPFDDAT